MTDDQKPTNNNETAAEPTFPRSSLYLVNAVIQDAINQELRVKEKMKEFAESMQPQLATAAAAAAEFSKANAKLQELSTLVEPKLNDAKRIAEQFSLMFGAINLKPFQEAAKTKMDFELNIRQMMKFMQPSTTDKIESAFLIRSAASPFVFPPKYFENTDTKQLEKDKEKIGAVIYADLMREAVQRKNRLIEGEIVRVKLPKKINWHDICIEFINGHTVKIKLLSDSDFESFRTYIEMGFKDHRTKLPNKQWIFLETLSKSHGIITWSNPKATNAGKKIKQLLSAALKHYFQLDSDAFENYRSEKGYKIKINLTPEVGSVSKNNEPVEDIMDGVEDMFGE